MYNIFNFVHFKDEMVSSFAIPKLQIHHPVNPQLPGS